MASFPALSIAAAACLHLAAAASPADVTISAPPGLVFHGTHPDLPLYERMPLEDALSFEIDFENQTGAPLTFKSAEAEYFDGLGRSTGTASIDAARFLDHLSVAQGSAPFCRGRVVADVPGTLDDNASSVAIDKDGKIVVAGSSDNPFSRSISLMRFNPDGTLDASFGAGGIVVTCVPDHDAGASAVAIDVAGRIVVCATGFRSQQIYADYVLVRYHADGTLDASFDGDGMAITPFPEAPGGVRVEDLAIDSMGRIVAAGDAWMDDHTYRMSVARYNKDGSLDRSFDGDGRMLVDFPATPDDFATAVAVDSSDRIVVAGGAGIAPQATKFALARLLPGGALDAGFGSGGLVITDFTGAPNEVALDVTIDPLGHIVAAGFAGDLGKRQFAVARYTKEGKLDGTFGTKGLVTTDFPTEEEVGTAVAVDSKGRVLVAGSAGDAVSDEKPADFRFALVRYLENGALDPDFKSRSIVLTDLECCADEEANAIAIAPNGTVVVAGSVGRPYSRAGGEVTIGAHKFALARYAADGSQDSSVGIAAGARVRLSFPFTRFPRKAAPARIDLRIAFAELAAPLVIAGIEPVPFEQNAGRYYIPLGNPAVFPRKRWFVREGHEEGGARAGAIPLKPGELADALRYACTFSVRDEDGKSFEGDNGYDNYFAYGEIVRAAADGTVAFARDGVPENSTVEGWQNPGSPLYGNLVVIDHGSGELAYYAFLADGSVSVRAGDGVRRGQPIGKVGNSGACARPQLHFHLQSGFDAERPDALDREGIPVYFVNPGFASRPGEDAHVQLRTSIPEGVDLEVAAPAMGLPALGSGPGAVVEVEPNGDLVRSQGLLPPASVHGVLELSESGAFADGGDPLEDLYRLELDEPRTIEIDLSWESFADLDVLVLDRDLRVLGPGAGTTFFNPERLTVDAPAGSCFIAVSSFGDAAGDVPYTLQVDLRPLPPQFVRGDCNGDGSLDLSDSVRALGILFLGTPEGDCLAACNTNAIGGVDISDAIFGLSFLFTGGPMPPAPWPECGPDEASESLSCERRCGA